MASCPADCPCRRHAGPDPAPFVVTEHEAREWAKRYLRWDLDEVYGGDVAHAIERKLKTIHNSRLAPGEPGCEIKRGKISVPWREPVGTWSTTALLREIDAERRQLDLFAPQEAAR